MKGTGIRALAAAWLALLVGAVPAVAYWTTTGSGAGQALTATIGETATPAATISGTVATVSWTQTAVGAGTVGGFGGRYEVRRQPAAGGTAVTPPAGSCATAISGTAATLQCSETSVPVGSWRYTVRPLLGSWTGAASAPSAIVTVAPSGPELDDPGRYVRGTITLTGRSGTLAAPLQTISIQRRTGTGNWTDICTATASPISCSFNTTTVVDADYEMRTQVVDGLGTISFSAVRAPVTIDNTVPVASITAPPARVRGVITLNGTATDAGSGLASVRFQYRLAGTTPWTDGCTASGSGPAYSCAFTTTSVADGSYELRVLATDRAGNQGNSTTASTVVDNTAPLPTDIQLTNATGTLGRADNGDVVTFSWSEPIDPTSILAGWNGSTTAVQVRMIGCRTINATLTVYNSAGTTQLPLGSVDTGAPHVDGTDLIITCLNGTLNYSATMTRDAGVVRVVLTDSLLLGPRTERDNATAIWAAPAGTRDVAGNPSLARSVTEGGPADPNF